MHLRRFADAMGLGLVLLVVPGLAHAQYQLSYLVSNQVSSLIPTIDPLLANPWGLARSAGSPWWIADNDTGWSTLYNAAGAQIPLRVVIPTAGNGPVEAAGLNGPGSPTGVVFNGSKTDFQVSGVSSSFIFATLDGTISAWPGLNKNMATQVVDNSAKNASYTGLAITSNASGNILYAADAANNKIDMFDGSFNFLGSFGDPTAPANTSVFGIQDINGMVYVTYAVPGVGFGGVVDIFNENGTFVKTLVHDTSLLNQAWGIALAPNNFGPLSNTLLISNNAVDGTINGFDPVTGKYVGTISNVHAKIVLNNLWGIAFGGGTANNGATNELFLTVGPGIGSNELAGVFAKIVVKP